MASNRFKCLFKLKTFLNDKQPVSNENISKLMIINQAASKLHVHKSHDELVIIVR